MSAIAESHHSSSPLGIDGVAPHQTDEALRLENKSLCGEYFDIFFARAHLIVFHLAELNAIKNKLEAAQSGHSNEKPSAINRPKPLGNLEAAMGLGDHKLYLKIRVSLSFIISV
jgi:hypothetical protein